MGIKYLWDTNIAIYFLQNQFPPHAADFIDGTLTESLPAISAITEIELLCWDSPSEADEVTLRNFVADAWIFELENEIKLRTAEIRKGSKIKLPDAIIAATALIQNLTLLTRNMSDFKNIAGLQVIDPFKIEK
ncbi:MAG: type II toxin-antitoxin system VapC family toxin [Pricia sp.]